jgi:hypothetical protein
MRCPGPILPAVLLTAMAPLWWCCAASPERPHKPPRPVPTEAAQKTLLQETEALFRAGSQEAFLAHVDRCAADPVVAAWLTRGLVFHMLDARERQLTAEAERLPVQALADNPRYRDGLAGIVRLGPAAVPTLLAELIGHRSSKTREFGAEILGQLPDSVLPQLRAAFAGADQRSRRYLVLAVARMPASPAVETELLAFSRHEDFSVRAEALAGLAGYGERHLELLRRAVAEDPDPFVQRQIVMRLDRFPDRRTAAAVVDFYARAEKAGDQPGIRAAERTLIEMSGRPISTAGGRVARYGLASWREWLLGLPVELR